MKKKIYLDNQLEKLGIEKFNIKFKCENKECENIKQLIEQRKTFRRNKYCSKECRNKISNKKQEVTNLKKFGVKVYANSEEFKKKSNITNLKKFGVNNYMSKDIKNYNLFNDKDFIIINFINKNNNFKLKEFMEFFQCSQSKSHKKLKELQIDYNHLIGTSYGEKEVVDFLQGININIDIILKDRNILNKKELDIYNIKYKFAIEYNGIFWHSFGSNKLQKNKADAKYNHINKTNKCQDKNIMLFHIFENEWVNNIKRQIWKSILLHYLQLNKILQIKNYKLIKIEKDIAYIFNKNNSLNSKTYDNNIGLFINDILFLNVSYFIKDNKYFILMSSLIFYNLDNFNNIIFKFLKYRFKINTLYLIEDRRFNKKRTYNIFKITEPYEIYFKNGSLKSIYNKPDDYNIDNYSIIYDSGNIIYEI